MVRTGSLSVVVDQGVMVSAVAFFESLKFKTHRKMRINRQEIHTKLCNDFLLLNRIWISMIQ